MSVSYRTMANPHLLELFILCDIESANINWKCVIEEEKEKRKEERGKSEENIVFLETYLHTSWNVFSMSEKKLIQYFLYVRKYPECSNTFHYKYNSASVFVRRYYGYSQVSSEKLDAIACSTHTASRLVIYSMSLPQLCCFEFPTGVKVCWKNTSY